MKIHLIGFSLDKVKYDKAIKFGPKCKAAYNSKGFFNTILSLI